jgi:hypothetical protein
VTVQIATTARAIGRKYFLEFLVTASATLALTSTAVAKGLAFAMSQILELASKTLTVTLAEKIRQVELVRKIIEKLKEVGK